jgi:hypothetical protein
MYSSATLHPHRRAVALGLTGFALASGLGFVAHVASSNALSAGVEADAIGEVTGTQGQPVPVPPSGEWVYGARLHFAGAEDSSGKPVTLISRTPQVCEVEGADGDYLRLVAAGGCSVSVHQDGDEAYAAFDGNLDRQVAPRTLEVSVADASRPPYAEDPVWQLEYDGLLDGDAVATAPTVAHPPRDAAPGRYPLVPSGGSVPNYRLTYAPGVLTVDPVLTVAPAPAGALAPRVVVPYGTEPSLSPVEIEGGTFYVSTDALEAPVTTSRSISYSTIPVQIAAAPLTDRVAGLLRSKWGEFQEAYLDGDMPSAATRLVDLIGEANAAGNTENLNRHLLIVYNTMIPAEYRQ